MDLATLTILFGNLFLFPKLGVSLFQNLFLLGFFLASNLGAGMRFGSFFGDEYITTEINTHSHLDFSFKVKKITVTVAFNTSTGGDTFIGMRDDSVTVPNSTVTIPASTTGKFNSGDIDELVDQGSLINLFFNRVGGANLNRIAVDVECFK